jgi:hypothetical protein
MMKLRERTNLATGSDKSQPTKSSLALDAALITPRRIVKAVRVFKRPTSTCVTDGSQLFSDDGFNRAINDWMSPPNVERSEAEITFPSYNSIPPQPDYSLLLDFALAEERGDFAIPVRNGCMVTKEVIMAEHGSMDNFLDRMLAQMIKRRWFAALTEFNTTHLFGSNSPPSRFLWFLQLVHKAIEDSICADAQLADLWRAGRIKLVLKGGNCVALLKLQALELLPADIARRLECIRPSSLSDVDFLLMLDPALPGFAALHDRLRAAAARGLAAAADRLFLTPPFGRLLASMADPASLALQGAAVAAATRALRDDVAGHGPPRHVPAVSRLLRALDALAAAGGARVRPELRQDIELRHGAAATTVVARAGRPGRIYVSNNPDIEHRPERER